METITIEKKTLEIVDAKFKDFVTKLAELRSRYDKRMSEWMDNSDVCQILNISKRTLQTYRDNGTIPFARINRKMFYKKEDIEKLLEHLKAQGYLVGKINISH